MIVLFTDFGLEGPYIGQVSAVLQQAAPGIPVISLFADLPPGQPKPAAYLLAAYALWFPIGTVFLCVVDPGVGTSRKAIIVKSKKGQFFVLPDNGLVTAVIDRDGFEGAHEITNQNWKFQAAVSSTFHGRDIFSPAAAHLAEGWDYTIAGPKVSDLVRLTPQTATLDQKGVSGEVLKPMFESSKASSINALPDASLNGPLGPSATATPGDLQAQNVSLSATASPGRQPRARPARRR